jgi:hypothetical protein
LFVQGSLRPQFLWTAGTDTGSVLVAIEIPDFLDFVTVVRVLGIRGHDEDFQ